MARHPCRRGQEILVEDATGTMAVMQFEMLGAEDIAVPPAVMYLDHNVLQINDKNMQDHRYLRSFSEQYGRGSAAGTRDLALHPHRAVRPAWASAVGADSHTTTSGALGMFATGAGGLAVPRPLPPHRAVLTSGELIAHIRKGGRSPVSV